MITGVDSNLWEEPLQDVKSIANKQVKTIDDFINHDPFFKIISRLTAGVSRLGWERGLAAETEKAQSQNNAEITRCVPQVDCTLC